MRCSKIALVITVGLFAFARSAEGQTSTEATSPLPGVTKFFAAHPKYGSIPEVRAMPDWAQGARQQVVTDRGAYLVYLKGKTVVTVYANDANGRRELWRKPGH